MDFFFQFFGPKFMALICSFGHTRFFFGPKKIFPTKWGAVENGVESSPFGITFQLFLRAPRIFGRIHPWWWLFGPQRGSALAQGPSFLFKLRKTRFLRFFARFFAFPSTQCYFRVGDTTPGTFFFGFPALKSITPNFSFEPIKFFLGQKKTILD